NGKAGTESEEWEGPPIPLCDEISPAPFPVDVFPRAISSFAVESAQSVGVPIDFICLPILAITGTAIGATRALQIKAGWVQRALFYGAVVGEPGDGKTPAIDFVAKPIYQAQLRLKVEYEKALEQYEADLAEYNRQKAQARENPDAGPSTPPEKPRLARVMVDDATVESLAPILASNSRGIGMIRDELSAWVTSQNQYKGGKGSDRQFWLKNWAGVIATTDRKHQQTVPVIIPHPFV